MNLLRKLIILASVGSASGRLGAAPGSLLRAYNGVLLRHPVTSTLVTGGVVTGLGDVACQAVIEKRGISDFQTPRMLQAAIVGSLWSGYCSPKIYHFAERVVGPGKGLRKVALKMLVTTAILSSVGNYINMSMRRMMAGGYREPGGVFQTVNSQIVEVMFADWKVWPVYDALCFKVIPLHLRGATTVAANTCWGAYLSFMSNKYGGPAHLVLFCTCSQISEIDKKGPRWMPS